MFFLALSFFAGVLSVFAACVLPLLPVIVGGSLTAGGSRRRMYTIVVALAVSIIVFTLILKASTALIGIPEYLWQYLSGGIIMVLGVFILFPHLWTSIPGVNALYVGSNKALSVGYQRGGFWGDVVMGVALGPVFASCSPTYFLILATVLPAQPVLGLVYLAAYALGLSLALLLIAILGEKLVQRLGITLDPSGWFYRGIGVLLVVVGVLIFTGSMKKVETWFVERGFDATFIELRLLGSEMNPTPVLDVETISADMKAARYQKAPELVSPDGYINTGGKPITIGEFKGKNPVLIDIWTYSCINCQRTLPYLRAWYEKYERDGLVIIGVHTPEFAFEKVQANVEEAVKKFGLTYPVILDNEYQTWNAFGNRFWPRKYLIDIDGYIVYDHAGEGDYDGAERAIQRVLAERAERLGSEMPEKDIASPEDAIQVDFRQVQSPEIYFGAWRNERLGNGNVGVSGIQNLTLPEKLFANTLYLLGRWDIQEEYAASASASAGLRFIYTAKNVYMVAAAKSPVRMKVTRNEGELLGDERGSDVDADGWVTVQEERLYELVKGDDYRTHILEITVEENGLEAYTFTFG